MLAYLKEPEACGALGRIRLPAAASRGEAVAPSFHQSLVALAEAMDGSRSSTLVEIGRQGVMRLHGCAVVLQQLRIVKPVRDDGQNLPHRRVKLGRTQTEYVVLAETDVARKLEEVCDSLSMAWRDVLQLPQSDLAKVVTELTRIVVALRNVTTATQQASYIVAHLVRKMFLCYLQYRGEDIDWGDVTVGMLDGAFPDKCEYLSLFPEHMDLASMSSLVLGRRDMGVFLSMFACVWRDVARRWAKEEEQALLLDDFGTDEFHSATVSLIRDKGHSVCPFSAVSAWSSSSSR